MSVYVKTTAFSEGIVLVDVPVLVYMNAGQETTVIDALKDYRSDEKGLIKLFR